jgi:hypothetical protein
MACHFGGAQWLQAIQLHVKSQLPDEFDVVELKDVEWRTCSAPRSPAISVTVHSILINPTATLNLAADSNVPCRTRAGVAMELLFKPKQLTTDRKCAADRN